MERSKLTPSQVRHLERIAAGPGDSKFPAAGWFGSKSEQKLEALGLVRHWEHVASLGGPSTMGMLSVRWQMAEATEAGRAWLRAQRRAP